MPKKNINLYPNDNNISLLYNTDRNHYWLNSEIYYTTKLYLLYHVMSVNLS